MRRPLGVNVVAFELGQEFAKQLRIFGLDMILAHVFSRIDTKRDRVAKEKTCGEGALFRLLPFC